MVDERQLRRIFEEVIDFKLKGVYGELKGVNTKLNSLEIKLGSLEYKYDMRFVSFDEKFEQIDKRFDTLYNKIDGIAGRIKDDAVEQAAISNKLERHHKWIGQLGKQTGAKLTPKHS
jgi:hypothetical protein